MFPIYDILMLAVFAAAIGFGWWKGLAWQIASLAAVIASYFVAVNFRGVVTPLIGIEPPWNGFAAMLILYLGTSLAVWVGFSFVRGSIERMHLKEFDRQAGAGLGALKGALLCMVVTMFAVTVAGERARAAVINSRSGNLIARSINQLSAVVPADLHRVLDPYFQKFNQRLAEPLPPPGAAGDGVWTFGIPDNAASRTEGQPVLFRLNPGAATASGQPGSGNMAGQLSDTVRAGAEVVDRAQRLLQESRNGSSQWGSGSSR